MLKAILALEYSMQNTSRIAPLNILEMLKHDFYEQSHAGIKDVDTHAEQTDRMHEGLSFRGVH